MDGFFRAIPEELAEAAVIDGCSRWTALIRIDLPLALPGVAASGIFAFLTCWNEFALASVITRTPASRTFPPALYEFTGAIRLRLARHDRDVGDDAHPIGYFCDAGAAPVGAGAGIGRNEGVNKRD